MSISFILYLLFIVAPIGTFIHESGHALGARLVHADYVLLSIGRGKRVMTWSFNKVHIIIHAYFFMGGYVNSERTRSYTPNERCLIALCGPVLNGIGALGLFYVDRYILHHDIIGLLFLFNVWLAIINIIPFKIGDRQSDGYTILSTLINRPY